MAMAMWYETAPPTSKPWEWVTYPTLDSWYEDNSLYAYAPAPAPANPDLLKVWKDVTQHLPFYQHMPQLYEEHPALEDREQMFAPLHALLTLSAQGWVCRCGHSVMRHTLDFGSEEIASSFVWDYHNKCFGVSAPSRRAMDYASGVTYMKRAPRRCVCPGFEPAIRVTHPQVFRRGVPRYAVNPVTTGATASGRYPAQDVKAALWRQHPLLPPYPKAVEGGQVLAWNLSFWDILASCQHPDAPASCSPVYVLGFSSADDRTVPMCQYHVNSLINSQTIAIEKRRQRHAVLRAPAPPPSR